MQGTFKYFSYGSNLLQNRIHVKNPSAKRLSIGKLKDYRLDFKYWAKRWHGNVATIVPHEGKHVWGAIWEIDNINSEDLDRQEGVQDKVYEIIYIDVENASDGSLLKCKSYHLTEQPSYQEVLPVSRYPSKIYLDTIIKGAIESELPADYITLLNKIPHNGFEGPINVFDR